MGEFREAEEGGGVGASVPPNPTCSRGCDGAGMSSKWREHSEWLRRAWPCRPKVRQIGSGSGLGLAQHSNRPAGNSGGSVASSQPGLTTG